MISAQLLYLMYIQLESKAKIIIEEKQGKHDANIYKNIKISKLSEV